MWPTVTRPEEMLALRHPHDSVYIKKTNGWNNTRSSRTLPRKQATPLYHAGIRIVILWLDGPNAKDTNTNCGWKGKYPPWLKNALLFWISLDLFGIRKLPFGRSDWANWSSTRDLLGIATFRATLLRIKSSQHGSRQVTSMTCFWPCQNISWTIILTDPCTLFTISLLTTISVSDDNTNFSRLAENPTWQLIGQKFLKTSVSCGNFDAILREQSLAANDTISSSQGSKGEFGYRSFPFQFVRIVLSAPPTHTIDNESQVDKCHIEEDISEQKTLVAVSRRSCCLHQFLIGSWKRPPKTSIVVGETSDMDP